MEDNLEYNYDSDFETTHINWEQESQSKGSRISFYLSATAKTPPSIQMVLGNKEKDKLSNSAKSKRSYKHRQPSFTWEYFKKKIDDTGEEVRICQILDESRQKCEQKYKNVESSTGNLIVHLRDEHRIISQDDVIVSKNINNITDNAYREKIAEFDPSFVVPGEKKIRTMIVKSFQYNHENLKNLIKIVENISLTMDFWSSRAKHGYLGVTATWITSNFEIKDVMLKNKY
ncbi:15619_t:CDS:2, partial [Cetraspora pellucida]